MVEDNKDLLSPDQDAGALAPATNESQPQPPTDPASRPSASQIVRSALRSIGCFAICAIVCFAIQIAFILARVFLWDLLLDFSIEATNAIETAAYSSLCLVETLFIVSAIAQIVKIYRRARELRAVGVSNYGGRPSQTTRDDRGRPIRPLNESICSALRSFALCAIYAVVCFSSYALLSLLSAFEDSRFLPESLGVVAYWSSIVVNFVLVVLMFVQISRVRKRARDLRAAAFVRTRENDFSSSVVGRIRLDMLETIDAGLKSSARFSTFATVCLAVAPAAILFFLVAEFLSPWDFERGSLLRAVASFLEEFLEFLTPVVLGLAIAAICVCVFSTIVCAVGIFRKSRRLRALENLEKEAIDVPSDPNDSEEGVPADDPASADGSRSPAYPIVRSATRAIGYFAICATVYFASQTALMLAVNIVRRPLVAANRVAFSIESIMVVAAIFLIAKIYRRIRDLSAANSPAKEKREPLTLRDYRRRPTRTLSRTIRSALRSFALFAICAIVCFSCEVALFLVARLLGHGAPFMLYIGARCGLFFVKLVSVVLMFVHISRVNARLDELRADASVGSRSRIALLETIRAALKSSAKFATLATVCFAVGLAISLFFGVFTILWNISRANDLDSLADLLAEWIFPAASWLNIVASCGFVLLMVVCVVGIFRSARRLRALEKEGVDDDPLSLDKETLDAAPSSPELQSSTPSDVDSQTALNSTLRPVLRTVGKFAIVGVAILAVGVALSLAYQIVGIIFRGRELGTNSLNSQGSVYRTWLSAANWGVVLAKTVFLLLAIGLIVKIRRGIGDLRAVDPPLGRAGTNYGYWSRPPRTLNSIVRSALSSFSLFGIFAVVYFSIGVATDYVSYFANLFDSPKLGLFAVVAGRCEIFVDIVLVVLMFVQLSGVGARARELRPKNFNAPDSNSTSGVEPPRPDLPSAIGRTLRSVAKFALFATWSFAILTAFSLVSKVCVFLMNGPFPSFKYRYIELLGKIVSVGTRIEIVATIALVAFAIVQIVKLFRGVRDLRALESE